jgi:formylglycine-generating enzyme required for sulfatase activity
VVRIFFGVNEMPTCWACGQETPEGKFCTFCGVGIKVEPAKRPLNYCVKCGADSDAGAKFCTRCGALLKAPEAPKPVEPPKPIEPPKPAPPPKTIRAKDEALIFLIPAGVFWMGSPEGQGDNAQRPWHKVWLDAFYIDEHAVTFDQYDRFCEATGRAKPDDEKWGRGQRPVINVSWYDAEAYCKWAGKRLPTEAEWEKACRGGSDLSYCFGNDASKLEDYAWYGHHSNGMTHPVKKKKPNAFGLYDMHGNVWEWCSDWYDKAYYSKSPETNPTGPEKGQTKCNRGGSWLNDFEVLFRSACRLNDPPNNRYYYLGFRCAKSL